MQNVKRFAESPERNLIRIRDKLLSKTFKTSKYHSKMIYEPKQREIFILPFDPDRVVQHALMNVIEPIWESLFINDSYACRIGKGIHAGSNRTMEFVRRYKYCLKCDISKFYPSVDQRILFNIVKRKIKCRDTLWLIEDILFSYPGGKNVPIGNYTSQWFGNLYLNDLDQYLKHTHKIKGYIRYCDDFCLFHDDKKLLGELAKLIRDFVWSNLRLTLSKCDLFPVSRGVDFLGYRHFPKYILLRKSTAKRVKKRMSKLPELLLAGKISLEQFRSSVASTAGWLKWANSHNFTLSCDLESLKEVANGSQTVL
jgi:hypothetical protein